MYERRNTEVTHGVVEVMGARGLGFTGKVKVVRMDGLRMLRGL